MKFQKTAVLAGMAFACSFCAIAQPKAGNSSSQAGSIRIGKLSGQITDTKNKAVAYATVTLLRSDSTVVNGDLTKEDGSFLIEPTGAGSFLLRVNIVGFREKFIGGISITEAAPEKKMGKLAIDATSSLLKEVQVVGEKAMMEMSVDKKVFNVEKNISSTGGSATDVLKNVPSLAVDVDGDILLRGKETTLLIDGKPATLLGGDVASALQSLPASAIQSVEVITNPSARFDAQGMSGIINIITKKDNRFGLNGNVSLGAGTRNKYNGSLGLNLRNDKWNIFFNSNFRTNRNYQRTTTSLHNEDGSSISRTYEDNLRKHGGWFNTLGAEYTLNERNSVTLTENLNKMAWGNEGLTSYFVYSSPGDMQTRSNDNLGGPLSSSTSLDLKHKFAKPKQEITTNVTFAKTWVEREQEYVSRSLHLVEGNEIPYGPVITQESPGGGTNTSLNAQSDFTTPFLFKDAKLDAGWKTQLLWFESNNHATIDSGSGPKPDATLQNDYDYTQQIHAAYTSFGGTRGKLGYQAGLRLEYSRYEGTSSRIHDSLYANDFLSLFPSAYLSYKLLKDQAIYLSYTRRTNRPNFFQMMPYVDVSNPVDTSAGNPGLIPEFIHNTELNYSRQFPKGHMIMASAYYQYTQNLIDRIRRFNDETGKSFSQPRNLHSGLTYGLELTGKAQILPIWDATLNFNFFQNQIHGDSVTANLSNSGSSWFTKLNSNLRLPYGFSLQLSGSYEAPKVAAQGKVEEAYWLDIGIKKNLMNNKATIVLNVSDIFNTRKYTNIYDYGSTYQSVYRDRETRVGNITFSYRFGKAEMKSTGRKKEGGQTPVKERDNIKQGDDSQGF